MIVGGQHRSADAVKEFLEIVGLGLIQERLTL
jgi:hypothetical protein